MPGTLVSSVSGLQRGLARFGIEPNSLLLEKLEVRMIAGHGENLRGGNASLRRRILDPAPARLDARHLALRTCAWISPARMRFSMSGLTQYLRLLPISALRDEPA